MRRAAAVTTLATALATTAAALSGCFSAGEWPPKDGGGLAYRASPNHSPNDVIIVEALKFLVRMDYPDGVDEPIAINLPEGVTDRVYTRLARRVDDNAHPISPETKGYPTYHLVSFSVLGDRAGVDLLRPAPEIGVKPNGEPVYQAYYITVEGGMQPWRVTWAQPRPIDALTPPSLNYVGDTRFANDDQGAEDPVTTAEVEDGS
jgi:hypothetical protein